MHEGQWVSSYFTTLKFWWKDQNLNLNHLFCPHGEEPATKELLGSECKEEEGRDRGQLAVRVMLNTDAMSQGQGRLRSTHSVTSGRIAPDPQVSVPAVGRLAERAGPSAAGPSG